MKLNKKTMKITDEQIKIGLDEAFEKCSTNAYFGNGFRLGVKFALEQMSSSNDIQNVSMRDHYGELREMGLSPAIANEVSGWVKTL